MADLEFIMDFEKMNDCHEATVVISSTDLEQELRSAVGTIPQGDLISQLVELLKEDGFLPVDPKKAVLGTTLVIKVKNRLNGQFSENSIKNYFSSLSKDPQSPIAKVSGGFGYFRRPISETSYGTVIDSEEIGTPVVRNNIDAGNARPRGEQPEEKFRALYMKWIETESKFPAYIEHTIATRAASGTHRWKFPDVVCLDWGDALNPDPTNDGNELDVTLLDIKKSVGDRLFGILSVELKVEIRLADLREYFFQCVSNSKWANEAHLVVACATNDEVVEKELKRLGSSFNVSVTTFGLTRDEVDNLPNADLLAKAGEEQIAGFCKNIKRIYSSTADDMLDWEHIKDLRNINADFNDVFKWIAACLNKNKPYSISTYREIELLRNQLEKKSAGG